MQAQDEPVEVEDGENKVEMPLTETEPAVNEVPIISEVKIISGLYDTEAVNVSTEGGESPTICKICQHMQPTTTDENGGDPYVHPKPSRHSVKHVKAHYGFHNLKRDRYWAHWNDAFTTAVHSLINNKS